ncbi:SMODS domain-containing nucleotidyltransferase [Streptomyces purpurogeneiscleroticus]|uniref:SMODS domain-containing nucleotidyltransferase n=1 Tax=Streptomyces purpurogeneiscleroticus TaxID=68259 RepID=UPI001CC05BFC|nr:hypothetical protein [Streptomyces purpurogeneiscleroticus]MBZ4017871.1 hypothetical protein [Streptomyces purpurogeneiscleroticus]
MTYTARTAFGDFDQALALEPGRYERARRRHRQITAALKNVGLIESSCLQGSFARKTRIAPLDDIGMVMVFHRRFARLVKRPGGAADAMAMLCDTVTEAFPGSRFGDEDRTSRALQVTFADLDVTFGLTPALADPRCTDLLTANWERDTWERSTVRTLNRVIGRHDHATDGRFVHQVRMLKALRGSHPVLRGTSGLLWEALAYEAVSGPRQHTDAVAGTLAHAAQAVTGPVLDPTGSEDLTADWSEAQRAARAEVLAALAAQAAEARRREQAGDHTDAIGIWHDVFGAPFPSAADARSAETAGGTGHRATRRRSAPSPRARSFSPFLGRPVTWSVFAGTTKPVN